MKEYYGDDTNVICLKSLVVLQASFETVVKVNNQLHRCKKLHHFQEYCSGKGSSNGEKDIDFKDKLCGCKLNTVKDTMNKKYILEIICGMTLRFKINTQLFYISLIIIIP